MPRRILVTAALPYANGPIHIGHMVEYVQADTWVRAMRMRGIEVRFVCADDAHGTPIMLEAERLGISPEELVGRMQKEHESDFAGFGIGFDSYHSTHSEENRELSESIFSELKEGGLVVQREVDQLCDPARKQFLADRYVRGTCPSCGAEDQPGDNCDSCGATYHATDLKDPRSAISGARLEVRKSSQYFFQINKRSGFLQEWIAEEDPGPGPGPRLQPEARRKLSEWFADGLKDWDISRNAPYFGFRIPGEKDKYFYVWLDAPIGYMASFRVLCEREGIDFGSFWDRDSDAEVYHFIGKDIMNFHGLFWPAMLDSAGYRTPTRLFIHGFLTVNGAKMSKSKGTFITAGSYLKLKLDPDWFRYYIASKLSDRIEDVDLHMGDFVNRVNSDLVGKLANIPSRVAKILRRSFGNKVGPAEPWTDIDVGAVADSYERRRYGEVAREVMAQAEKVNRALERARPWEMAGDDSRRAELHTICSAAIEDFRILAACVKPVMPRFARAAEEYLAGGELDWASLGTRLGGGHELGEFRHLAARVTEKDVNRLLAANMEKGAEGGDAMIGIEDFAKVQLRVAEVLEAGEVDGSDRLLRLRVSLGGDDERTVFAGVKGHVEPGSLVGRKIVVCANLAPRKMRFGTSEGMALAAEGPGGALSVLEADPSVPAGAKVS